ncbi:NAD(P)/FAD-dependent oxidoreductase [Inquilinus limosus]|uniref:Pyridine nucleotide-disulfide oxidoreductase n=1 Tax=Inquilinus limosus TaxID=171674 RepID=A0A211ZSV4_9PROT|nr:FAD-dependent oxidoreductase [Inquilinus limosus]OWJ68167.1 pyridine nucleotide-disulfide oxidoreductase [Inquilinus limosus]
MTEPDVLVIGAGPAGLSAAIALRQAGVGRVTVLERQSVAGGIPRQCGHSPFGMREFGRILSGRRYADRLARTALSLGVDLRLRHSVVAIGAGPRVEVATPDGLVAFAPRRVILATGVREATRAARLVSGERPAGILNTGALQDQVFLRRSAPFRRPVIVGTELVSMSAVLTCLGAGARPAALVESGPRPLARAPFRWLPRLLCVPVHLATEIADIHGARAVEAVTLRGPDGTERMVACDGVLFTGRFTPEAGLARMSGIEIDPATGGPTVDTFGRTSLPDVYAAGNVLRGVETAGWCWAEGRAVARAVAADLAGRGAPDGPGLRIETGEGVRLVMPQSVAAGSAAPAFPAIQLRLDRPVRGELRAESDGQALWSHRLSSGPERRILVPLDTLARSRGHIRIRVHEA